MSKKEEGQSQTKKEIRKDFPTADREQGQNTIDWEYLLRKSEHERGIELYLLPCPFCGSPVTVEALEPAYQDGSFDMYVIRCTNETECGFDYLFDDDSPAS